MLTSEGAIDEARERREFLAERAYRDMVVVKNLKEHPVHRREARNNAGAYFDFANTHVLNAHISELQPGGKSRKHRHSNEAIIYIIAGRGYSILQNGDGPEMRVDWEEGDLLAIPAMWWHQHFNGDSETPARYLAVKNVPLMEKLGLFVVEQHPSQATGMGMR